MSFRVRVEPSGHEFTVEAGETVLDGALRHGITFPYGCRGGACGACRGKVLDGEISYGDAEPVALTDEDRTEGAAYFCCATAASSLVIEVKEVGSNEEIPVRKLRAKVAKLERVGDDVMLVSLSLPEQERLAFRAGQYVEFVLPDGRRRAFSIANPPHDDAYLTFHIRHVEGGRFTDHVFSDMEERELLTIEGPHGTFFLREDSQRPVILLATGTGFGPIKAMVEHAIAEGSTRPIYIYWGARTRKGLYMDGLARGWAANHENIHYIPVLSRPTEDDDWSGRTGHVQEVVLADFDDLSEFEVYACGHPQMVYSAKEILGSKGLDPNRCYSDAFEWAKD